jgi:hypothetical protein
MHVTQANPLPFGPEDEMRELCKALRSQPMTKERRYYVKRGSHSAHCCFEWSVMDSERKEVVRADGGTDTPDAICECYDEGIAWQIADALERCSVEPSRDCERCDWPDCDCAQRAACDCTKEIGHAPDCAVNRR